MAAYYNEFDPYAAQWLRNLIAAGHIAAGDVDERSIVDVSPDDLKSYTQVHFFAGIGGWSHALRLAMWPDDRPVWTGSCPCQPFSAAGKQRGTEDERHLWPVFHRLIAECRPAVVFGEQVASRLGRDWLCGVRADLEALEYAVAAADLCAAGTGAPHVRQRLYWLGDALGARSQKRGQRPDELHDAQGWADEARHPRRSGMVGDDTWAAFDTVVTLDRKTRRIEPGSFPLAHGVPGRVGRLRGYGNAIVPQVAAQFIKAAVIQ